jgi:hypothetical protein
MSAPRTSTVSWAALLIAVSALAVALAAGAIGLPGRGTVKTDDLSRSVKRSLDDPRAYALVTGHREVVERYSRGVQDGDVSVNNGAFCIRNIGFRPRHVQVTPRAADAPPKAILEDESACNGGTAVFFDGDLTYPEEFLVALFR